MKTLKLKKDVVSRLDREQSAMVKGGAGTQKNCATKDQLGLCVSATTCKSDNVIACVEVSKNDCIVSGGSCIQTKCDCLNTYALTCNCE